MSASKPRRRRRTERTDDWQELLALFQWPEQREYELIRPLVLFGETAADRAEETRAAERTLQRKAKRFEDKGVSGLFATEQRRYRPLPRSVRRFILDLKAEHSPLNYNEIANICEASFGRRPDTSTVARVLAEHPAPLRLWRRYPPYREISESVERRMAVVTLRSEGWSVKAIAGYMRINRDTVYRVLRRYEREGEAGLQDKPRGRPKGVRQMDLAAMDTVRRLQENPELGEFRMHAALAQRGIHLSPRTVGRILAANRSAYDLGNPEGESREPREMPFLASTRHRYWTVDVRYLDHGLPPEELEGYAYVISILENYSRAILASSVSTSQDLTAYLSVLRSAVEQYGSPEAIVSDGGGIFRATQANTAYAVLGIEKEEIERRQPWQSLIETTFNIQRRMADYYFSKAGSWEELVAAHGTWVENYNLQSHLAHKDRKDGRHSPSEVLGFVTARAHSAEALHRAFFCTHFSRVLDELGYARFRHWRVYGEEGLARCEVALWLSNDGLSVEFEGEGLSRYDVTVTALRGEYTWLREVTRPRLFSTRHRNPHPRLFELDDEMWFKALRTSGYAPRRPSASRHLQEALFPYWMALPG